MSGQGRASSGQARSKLANGLFSLELAGRLQGSRATSNALHPGLVDTNIFRNVDSRLSGRRMKTPAQDAATTCYVATSPALAGVSAYYFVDCNPQEPSAYPQDADMTARLWDVSEELAGAYLS